MYFGVVMFDKQTCIGSLFQYRFILVYKHITHVDNYTGNAIFFFGLKCAVVLIPFRDDPFEY